MGQGFLPCGLSFAAATSSTMAPTFVQSLGFMFAFGVSTSALILASLWLWRASYFSGIRVSPSVVSVILGVLMLARSMISMYHPETDMSMHPSASVGKICK